MFQQALWQSDASPEISWLLLVSSIENAASRFSADTIEPTVRLRRSFAKIHELLSDQPVILRKIAEELAPLTGATTKFLRFCKTFRPEPPDSRPILGLFDFDKSYEDAMEMIYDYRSRALHGGNPFPKPMCTPPSFHTDGLPFERPEGLASATMGASWLNVDTPMHLHLFAYIAQKLLLSWWKQLAKTAEEQSGAQLDAS